MPKTRYLTAQEAARSLAVKPSTIYAYVSRGLIRSEETGSNNRDRRYYAEDIEKLKARREGRIDPDRVAERALHVGSPVLDSKITLITEDTLYYRGQDVLNLARTETIERVASLIWTGSIETDIPELRATDYELHPASLTEFADRLFHDWAGWMMMPLALALLWLEMWFLSHIVIAEEQHPMSAGLAGSHN